MRLGLDGLARVHDVKDPDWGLVESAERHHRPTD
jgi:hypothetical protein